jgi:hypothetical protein
MRSGDDRPPLLLPDVGGCTNPAEGLTRPVVEAIPAAGL